MPRKPKVGNSLKQRVMVSVNSFMQKFVYQNSGRDSRTVGQSQLPRAVACNPP
jgi:hypothetical protein